MPTQAATRDLVVWWMPSLHREQETTSTKGPRAALMTVGARSVGRIRTIIMWSGAKGVYLGGDSKSTKQRLNSKRSSMRHAPGFHRCRQGCDNSMGETTAF